MVSIVMPVHNTGVYLEESIGSILGQTYEDFELICVDDASDDAITKKLLQKYGREDKRIRLVFLEENLGAANARNTGMEIAAGEYIIFLDADDIFDNTMIEKMLECIVKHDADICICGYKIYSDIEKKIAGTVLPVQKVGVTDRVFQLGEMPEDGLRYWAMAPWNKMCRKSFLEEQIIYFQTLQSSNDVFFSCMCAICAKKIVYCQGGLPLISYRFGSQIQISANRDPMNFFRAISFLLDVREKQISIMEQRQIIYLLLKGVIDELCMCPDEKKKEKCYCMVQEYLNRIGDIVFKEDSMNAMLAYFKNKKYESKWYEAKEYLYIQLKENCEYLLERLWGKSRIVVWGNGARGNALQRLCREKDLDAIIVTDIKNERLGEKTKYGYFIVSTEQAMGIAEVVIATNKKIYQYLLGKKAKYVIINLEKYCPWA